MNNFSLLKHSAILLAFFVAISSSAQIEVSNDAPYDSPIYLIDSLLLGSGVVASNHQFAGDPNQIGFFNGILTNLGLDSGIVMSTGDIDILVPGGGFGGAINSNANDPDLLTVANSVPELIGQNFVVSSVNDVVILEFDFVPTSSFLSFKYVFGSQEYFAYENTQYNDVFGFFISGPGIVGPYASPVGFPDGSINIATIPDTDPEIPITISSVNATENSEFFVNNQGLETVADADGFTTIITAEAEVQCGETYHIRLSIADGSDTGLSSYVFLEAGSFTSPELQVSNSLNVDSNKIFTDCGVNVDLTADIDGSYDFVWNTGSDNQTITVGPGSYWVEAVDETGCAVNSDTIVVYSQPIPEISFSDDTEFCFGESLMIESNVTDGTLPYTFDWNSGFSNVENLDVIDGGQYILTVIDSNGCMDTDTINITQYSLPQLSYGPEEIVICGGNPVEVSAYGADTYSWSPVIGLDNPNSQVVNMSSSASITYTLAGTDTNGCVSTIEIETTAANGFEIDVFTNPVTCLGYDDGSISIIAGTGAVTPVSYSIDGGETFNNYFVYDNLPFGTYEVLAMDDLGCTLFEEVVVESSEEPIQIVIGAEDAICNDENGLVFVESITGGSVGSNGYNLSWFSSNSPDLVSTDSSVSVPSGSYFLVVTDDNACVANDQVIVEEPNDLNLVVETSDVSCYGAQDGAINLTVMGGGNPPYSYNWINYGGADSPNLFNLGAGQYDLEITDDNGCVFGYSFTINSPSQPLTLESSSSEASCFGVGSGSAFVEVSGGVQPYFYNWSSGHVTPTAEELFAGDYSVIVTDASGCQLVDSITVSENPQIFTEVSSSPNTCYNFADGSASINATGGTGQLSFLWSNQLQQNAVFGLSYGNYWVITEDDLGCKVTDSVLVEQPENI